MASVVASDSAVRCGFWCSYKRSYRCSSCRCGGCDRSVGLEKVSNSVAISVSNSVKVLTRMQTRPRAQIQFQRSLRAPTTSAARRHRSRLSLPVVQRPLLAGWTRTPAATAHQARGRGKRGPTRPGPPSQPQEGDRQRSRDRTEGIRGPARDPE
jgi:hypothetical protein